MTASHPGGLEALRLNAHVDGKGARMSASEACYHRRAYATETRYESRNPSAVA
jgi:hypothetical protein